jgi:hypothetical protein
MTDISSNNVFLIENFFFNDNLVRKSKDVQVFDCYQKRIYLNDVCLLLFVISHLSYVCVCFFFIGNVYTYFANTNINISSFV